MLQFKFTIDRAERSLERRLTWGVSWGVALASVFSLFAVLQFAVHATAMIATYDLGLVAIIAIYLAGGIFAGVVVGLLLTLARRRAGAAFVGMLAILPIALMIQFATLGDAHWHRDNTAVVIIGTLLLGVPLGLTTYDDAADGGDCDRAI